MSKTNKYQEQRNRAYRIRFSDSELAQVINLKAQTGEVPDSLATFIAKTIVELATVKGREL